MTHEDLQRRLARVCFDAVPSPDDIAALGDDPARWMLYRVMVRGRFVDTFIEALPRFAAALGRERLTAAVDAWLAEAPPTTRYVRELSIEFARFLEGATRLLEGASPWALDAIRYDAAVMRCHIALDATRDGVTGLDMALPVALSPAQQLVRVSWRVHLDGAPEAKPIALVAYRAPGTDAIETLELTPVAADIYEAMTDDTRSLTDCATSALARNDSAAGQVFIETFADFLGDLLDRGVLLGSRTTAT